MDGAAANAPEFACGGRKFPPRPMPALAAAQGRGTVVYEVSLTRRFKGQGRNAWRLTSAAPCQAVKGRVGIPTFRIFRFLRVEH